MLVQLTMFPTSNRGRSVFSAVSKVVDIIDRSGLPYKTGPMSTAIEGDWSRVMKLINKCRLALRKSHARIYINITIDDRRGARNRLTGKTDSIERKLGRKVNR